IAHTDDRIRAEFAGVCEHEVERVLPRALAQVGVKRDVAAEKTLDVGADVADDRPRPHHDAAHNAERFGDAITGQLESGGRQRMGLAHSPLIEHHAAPAQKLNFTANFPRLKASAETALLIFRERNFRPPKLPLICSQYPSGFWQILVCP